MMFLKISSQMYKNINTCVRNKITYVQGQSSLVAKAKREYFYYIDHRGQVNF